MTAADSGAPRIDTSSVRTVARTDRRRSDPLLKNALLRCADEIDHLRARLAEVEGNHDLLRMQIAALSVPGHECVWDATEWICQDCWEKNLPSKWPCAAARGEGDRG